MSRVVPFTDPEMRQILGGAIEAPDTAPRSQRDRLQRTRTPLQDEFPEPGQVCAGFRTISTASINAPSGSNAKWYGLVDINVTEQLGQDVAPFLFKFDLASPDVDGAGSANAIAWGTVAGREAAIVWGVDLPIAGKVGQWIDAPVPFAGVVAAGTQGVTTNVRTNQAWNVAFFPAGKLTNAIPGRSRGSETLAPWAYRLRQGGRLQVAFVTRGNNFAGGGSDEIVGECFVSIHYGLTATVDHYKR